AIIGWSVTFALTYVLVACTLGDALEWLLHHVGVKYINESLFYAIPVVVFGGATTRLIWWTHRARAPVIACAVGTLGAVAIFCVFAGESAEIWAPVTWNTVTSLGFCHAVWPRMPVRGGCRVCGYDLDGLSSNRCPECGTPFPFPRS